MKTKLLSSAIALATAFTTAAAAGETGWYIQAGPANVSFSESTELTAGGGAVPGSNVAVSTENALGLGVGYFFNPNMSVIGIVGSTPTSTINGEGTIAGLPVGEVTYGPSIFAANYHFNAQGKFQPFVGAGFSYTKVFDTEDGLVTGLTVDDAFGGVLRVGFDYMLDEHQGIFFSANKIFIDTTITGTVAAGVPGFGGAPVTANVDLNPLIMHAGYAYRW